MSTQPSTIVQRLWNYCNVLRDDGMSSGDTHTSEDTFTSKGTRRVPLQELKYER